jgi:endonuclease-3 related protein
MLKTTNIYDLYKELLQRHGHPRKLWPQWCAKNKSEDMRQLVAIGAILVQRTSWKNAEKALVNLKNRNLLSINKIAKLENKELTKLIRVAGFYSTKPKRLKEFCHFVLSNYGDFTKMTRKPIKDLRKELLSVYGIGPETADTIILYSLDKPSFIIDEYTKRFVNNNKLSDTRDYNKLQDLFENNLPRSTEIYQNYHILIIIDQKGKDWCVMKKI